MAKYRVLKKFKNIHTKEIYTEGAEIELTEDRAAEVIENLRGKGLFIEAVVSPREDEAPEEFDRAAAKDRLKDLGVEFKENAKNETLKQLLEENEGGN